MGHAAAPSIQLPHQHTLEPLEPGVPEKLVEPRTAGGGTAESRIYVFLKDLPALAGDIFSEGVELRIATLVRRTDSGVNSDDHGL
jgi:hypothetical protein